jgi:2-dehydro-3-deoxygluconokinase
MTDMFTMGEGLAVFAGSGTGPLRNGGNFTLKVAGSELNVAIGVARLGLGAAWVGRIGADEFGRAILRTLRAEGVDTSAVPTDPSAPTALMIKERRTADVSRVVYYRAGSAGSRLAPADVPVELVRASRLTHLTGITPALSGTAGEAVMCAAITARAAERTVSFDINYRSALWSAPEASASLVPLVRLSDVVFVGADDLALLVDEEDPALGARAVAALGPRQVVVTMGSEGSVAWIDGETYRQPALPVTTVDPVGAGDAFAAGYLAAMLSGGAAERRLLQGATTAALVVGVDGDWEGSPSSAELALAGFSRGHVHR